MAALVKLKEQGWNITDDGFKKITDDGRITDVKEIVKVILDTDFREFGGGGFPFELNKGGKVDALTGNVALQVLKVSNVSAPKSNQDSKAMPRLLKIEFTDGQIQYPGLEFELIPELSLNTPPGTKILLKNGPIKISNGFLLLGPKNIDVLGGKVAQLFEKWEQYRLTTKYSKSVVKPNTGAPSWSMFGKQLDKIPDNLNFKSLLPEQEKENAEFEALRKITLDEAVKLQQEKPKVFGGGKVRIIDHNVQKITDKGYTIEQAKNALKYSRNNLEKAFASLKRQCDSKGRNGNDMESNRDTRSNSRFSGRDDRFGRRGGRNNREEEMESKPTGKLSLFDFLEDKLTPVLDNITYNSHSAQKKMDVAPIRATNSAPPQTNQKTQPAKEESVSSSSTFDRSKFENNISSSFRQKKEDPIPSGSSNTSRYSSNSYNQQQGPKRTNFAINNARPAKPITPGSGGSNTNTNSYQNQNGKYDNSAKYDNNYGKYDNSGKYDNPGKYDNSGKYDNPGKYDNSGKYDRYNRSNNNNAAQSYNYKPNNNNNNQYNDKASGSTTYPPKFQPRKYQNDYQHPSSQQQQHSHPNQSYTSQPSGGGKPRSNYQDNSQNYKSQIKKVTDSTAKLNINSSNSNQVTSVSAPSTPVSQPSGNASNPNAFNNNFSQIQNGYKFNPYKISGFQNKETNDFAMNVMKQENYSFIQQQPQQQQRPSNVIQIPISIQPATLPIQNYITSPQPTQQQSSLTWKIGDRCLAKYWEDAQYYTAEITGVSDKTLVVHFLEYGNFEEVLKDDILPVGEAYTFYPKPQNNNQSYHQHQQQQHHHQQQQQHHHHHQHNPYQQNYRGNSYQRGGGNPNHSNNQNNNSFHHHPRYREERPMYVPPAQRNPKN